MLWKFNVWTLGILFSFDPVETSKYNLTGGRHTETVFSFYFCQHESWKMQSVLGKDGVEGIVLHIVSSISFMASPSHFCQEKKDFKKMIPDSAF